MAYQAPLSMGFSKQDTGGGYFLLQGIFPAQESNPGLPHCRQIVYCLSHQKSPNYRWCAVNLGIGLRRGSWLWGCAENSEDRVCIDRQGWVRAGEVWEGGMQASGVLVVPLEGSALELWSPKTPTAWVLEPWGPQREAGVSGVCRPPPRVSPAASSGIWGSPGSWQNMHMCFHYVSVGLVTHTRLRSPSLVLHCPMSPSNGCMCLATWRALPNGKREAPSRATHLAIPGWVRSPHRLGHLD